MAQGRASGSGAIQEVFEEAARAHARREAVVCGPARWNYDQLNRRANRIAHALLALGVAKGEPVAVALPRGAELIAALLGVLKAGGAYVPIPDNQPIPRLRKILADASPRVLIGDPDHLSELHSQVASVLTIDAYADRAETNPGIGVGPSDLAYIMYTSGSTGEPKGVMIEHDGVLRLVHDQWFMPTGPDVHYLCVSSFGFDASTIEIYAALLHGAKLVITQRRVPEPIEVARLIRDEGVRAAWIAFGFFGALFESQPSMFEGVGVVMTGGEPVTPELIRRAQRALPRTRFVNSYGPTECTALSTAYQIPDGFATTHPTIPIGRALRGMRLCLLDERGERVEGEGEGELYIGGVGIARGYLNKPELTAQRFLPDPDMPGGRVYRTGDLVRRLPDGELLFLGRLDSQVKLRGNRMELGEVEAVAATFPGVRACAAAVFETGGTQALGLLVVPESQRIDPEAITDHLAKRLPEYMVPGRVVNRPRLPLNSNGKTDRAQVAAICRQASQERDPASSGKPLETGTERALAEIIAGLLDTPVRSADDSFLSLGGHSLRAVVLCSRIRDRFGTQLPISTLYELGTIGRIAAYIDDHSGDPAGEWAIRQLAPGERAPLSFNQQRLWMLNQLAPGDTSYNITILLEHDEPLDRDRFERAWSLICERHEVLRSCIATEDEIPFHRVGEDGEPRVHWIECEAMPGDELDHLITRESQRAFDLQSGPLVRCVGCDLGERAVVVITMNHIISDAWSCEILQRELRDAYTALEEGRVPVFPPLPIRYADYAAWERRLTELDSYRDDLEYWRRTLGGAPVLELPTDHPRSASPDPQGSRLSMRLETGTMERTRAAAGSLGITPFAYMLGVFKVWLHRMTLQEDLVVGAPVANREHTQTEGLIGFFMETMALRTRVECTDTLGRVLKRVARVALEGFDHRDVPFQHIVESLPDQAGQGRNPLFEVFFNHIAIRLGDDGRDGRLRFSPREVDNRTAKFDLTCYVFDQPDAVEIVFNYRSRLFEEATIERFLGQYARLLEASPTSLDTPISQLPVLDEREPIPGPASIPDQRLASGMPRAGLIPAYVERVVRRHPERPALRSRHASLSYEELWERSSSVSARLLGLGVAPGERVVLGSSDPLVLCCAVLGALRVGAVFVPVDPHWPDQRIEQIARLAAPAALLLDPGLLGRLPALNATPIEADASPSATTQGQAEVPAWAGRDDDPAYMMFTSGSTGAPKGVVQTHAGVVGHMHAFAASVGLTPDDRLLQVSSPAFDGAIMDMFGAWFTGACLCVCDIQRSDPPGLAAYIIDQQISVYHSAPSVFRWLTRGIDEHIHFPGVRTVVLGGEPVTRRDADELIEHFPNCARFINGMGMTESSLTLQLRIAPRELTRYPRRIPIGYPVEGVSVRLLDREGNPTTLSGEIEIESSRVATGYWDPEHRRVDPIGRAVGEGTRRRFRTGDLGMMLADGSIVHMGRRDHQVQVSGCRVETEEVASAIRALPGVSDGAVLARRTEQGDHELIAWVVTDGSDTSGPDALRASLGERLPGYMIPARWVRVERIPRVGGGKLDREALGRMKQLPSPVHGGVRAEPVAVNAKLPVVRDAFARVLGSSALSDHDSFFELGGNSLKAIRVFSILRRELGADLPISTIYRASTPALLAREIELFDAREEAGVAFIPLHRPPGTVPVYLLPGIGGHPLGFGPLVERMDPARGYVGVQYPDRDRLDAIGRSISQLARWLIERMDPKGGIAPDMIGYSFGGALGLEMAIQMQEAGLKPGRLVLLDAHLPWGLPKKGFPAGALTHLGRIARGREGRVSYISSRLRRASGEAQALHNNDPDELRDYREIARINRQMIIQHVPSGRYRAPVLLVQAIQPDWLGFHHDDGYNGFSRAVDPSLIERRPIDAAHMRLFKPGVVERLSGLVNDWFGHAQGRGSPPA